MIHQYIVCFDFHKSRSRFDPEDYDNIEYPRDFMLLCCDLMDNMLKFFPNNITNLSHNSFVLRTELTEDEIMELLVNKFDLEYYVTSKQESLDTQIYISKIENIKSRTLNVKAAEINYLFRK
jgi:hypothetical protein